MTSSSDPVDNQRIDANHGDANGPDVAVPNGVSSDSPNSSQPNSAGRKSFPWSALVIVAVLGGVATVLNWPWQYSELRRLSASQLSLDFPLPSDTLPVMAGWPLRYSIQYAGEGELPKQHFFSALALSANVACVLAVIILALVYASRRASKRGPENKRRQMTIGDLLLLTVVVALPFGYWQWLSKSAADSKQLVNSLEQKGAFVSQAAWIPELLVRRLPESMIEKFRKVRGARCENPSEELVREIVAIPTLSWFRVGGGDYDLSSLAPLSQRIHLKDLRVSGRPIDAATIEAIIQCKRIRSLNLMRTNVNASAAVALGNLPLLSQLNLMQTDLQFKDLENPGWSDTIEKLVVMHPRSGDRDELVIEHWPRLESLAINEMDSQRNPAPMKVRLAHLPRLREIKLDQFQKFDLELDDLPKLKSVTGLQDNWYQRIPRGGAVPGSLWFSRFDSNGTPELSSLQFFAVDLEWFSLKGDHKVDSLGIGVYRRTQNRNSTYIAELGGPAMQAILEGIGRSDGPPQTDLDALPFSRADLAPLAQNKGLTRLKLAHTNTIQEQWQKLSPMKWLTHLKIEQLPGQKDSTDWVLKTFPNLEALEYIEGRIDDPSMMMNYSGVRNIHYSGHPKLKQLVKTGRPFAETTSVRIVDMPELTNSIRMNNASEIVIRGSPKLSEILVGGPLPETCEIGEQTNLECFVVGGKRVDDKIVRSILNSDRLLTLTLAYPSASKEVLAQLPVANLISLSIPGGNIDDEVVQRWKRMRNVAHIDLSSTQITSKSVPKLIESTELKYLDLNGCDIQPTVLRPLAKRFGLKYLSLAGIGIESDILKAILQEGELTQLDLSDLTLDNTILDVILQHGQNLRHLGLGGSTLDNKRFLTLAKKHARLVFDLDGSNVSTETSVTLASRRRLEGRRAFIVRSNRESHQPYESSVQDRGLTDSLAAKMHVDAFAPNGFFANTKSGQAGLMPYGRFFVPTTPLPPTKSRPAKPPPTKASEAKASVSSQIGQALRALLGNGNAAAANESDTEQAAEEKKPAVESTKPADESTNAAEQQDSVEDADSAPASSAEEDQE